MFKLPDNIYYKIFDRTFRESTHRYVPKDDKVSNEEAAHNRNLMIQATKAKDIMFTQQVHGDRIIYAESGSVIEKEPEADGLYTDKKGVLLAIQTADCVPVLFFSENGNVVGAAHAGWKGAKLNILDRLYEKLSTKAKDFSAIICPSIQQKSYEVDSIFYGNFLEEDSGNDEFFIPSKKPMHFMFDLPTYVKRKLEKLLLKNIYHINEDTYSMKLPDDSFKYPSYRRSCHTGEFYPRSLVSTIMIKE